MNLDFSTSPFPMEENDHEHQPFNFNHHHINVSSSSSSCHVFFNPAQDHAAFYHPQWYHSHHHHPSYDIENKVENGLKLTLWEKEDQAGPAQNILVQQKWIMPPKKKKQETIHEVKPPSTSCDCEETTDSSSLSYNCNTPIRVCSDCHTTKTPLWRSGPKGPKSLCNACGIRQRKARRAVAAAAAAAANGGGVASFNNPPRAMKLKDKMGKSGLKKPFKLSGGGGGGGGGGGSSTIAGNGKKKNKIGFEDFLINLSNKLAIHRVFPQDEKEAAILLMALSSGLVHG